MIFTIVGTDITTREKAQKEMSKLGTATAHIYSEQISTLEPLISASSLFGEKIIVTVIQAFDVASSKEELVRLLPLMKESENIFIIDEPFSDANRVKMLTKYSEKVFDGREEKKKGMDVFVLCNLFGRRDKKGAWEEWMRIRDKESGEAIHGALWWKFQMIWGDVRDGKPSKFTLGECEEIGGRLALASVHAHSGKADLKVELEKIILGL
jgi:hypothetical protein